MISAKEAYEQAKSCENSAIKKQLKEVEIYITEAASNGESSMYYYKSLRNSVVEELRKNGYNVEKKPAEFNEIYYVISWGETE